MDFFIYLCSVFKNKMKNKTTFTIDEIKKYILSQDSLGDVLYNLSAESIINANTVKQKNGSWDVDDTDEFGDDDGLFDDDNDDAFFYDDNNDEIY